MDTKTLLDALDLACRAPSVLNTQPWRWPLGEHSVHLMADRTRAVPATDPGGRDLLMSCGGALHHLRVALAGLGVAAEVDVLAHPGDPDHLAVVADRGTAPDGADAGLAGAVPVRRTDPRRYSADPVPGEYLELMVERAAAEGALLVPVTDAAHREVLLTAAAEAARVQDRDPGHRREVRAWRGVEESGAPLAAADGSRLFVLATTEDDAVSHVRAGAAASTAMLTATSLGLATCPHSQPFEVARTRNTVRTELLDAAAHPQVVIRVGYAPPSSARLPAAPRRPLGEVAAALPGLAVRH